MFVKSVLALVGAQLTEIRRSKTAIFWMTAFPLGFLFLFGFVMARGDARVMAILMPGLLTTTLMSGGGPMPGISELSDAWTPGR